MEFSKRLTDNARDVLAHSEVLARTTGADYVGTEHLLLGILSQPQSVGAQVLNEHDVDFEKIRQALQIPTVPTGTPFSPTRGFSETAKLTLRMSVELAGEYHQDYCGTEHILFSLLNQKNSRALSALEKVGADIESIIADLEEFLERQPSQFRGEEELAVGRGERQNRGSFLTKFARNLTDAAKNGELDPVISRAREIDRVMTILSRRTKNNPVLIGEAGVGKTAIVEGLAEKIAEQDAPEYLLNKQVWQLDLAGMVAGTKYRGEFEERLKKLLDEVKHNDKLLIFIDELHLLTGAGAAEGAMDAANILKPALARGEFRLIGATTGDEYRKFIEKDAALARRLQAVQVEAPSAHDTLKILQGVAPKYEEHHKVKLPNSVLEEAVRLSERYLPERQQPDKALDVLDEAAARVHAHAKKSDQSVALKTYQTEKEKLTKQMEDAVAAEDYEKAALCKMRVSRLQEKIDETTKIAADQGKITLKLNDVAVAVSAMTGVPLQQLQRSEITRLTHLETYLSKHIIGQKPAIKAVAEAIRRSRAGISATHRPIGSFIFLGPTGVGKTELAKVLAREVFGSEKNLIKVDMSEFSERHTASRLVGAPAGYVGYDDGGTLTEKIRRQPYSVVLFDEIEKAHPDVFNLLLQILEDGKLTDGHNRAVDFSNTVVILTSNLGAQQMARDGSFGFSGAKDDAKLTQLRADNQAAAMKILREKMRPELLNRFDAIITFDALSREEVTQILDLMIENLNQRLAGQGVGVVVSKSAKNFLIEKGYDAKFGARPLRRTLQNELENRLAEQLITKEITRGDVVRASVKNGQMVLSKIHEPGADVAKKSRTQTTKTAK